MRTLLLAGLAVAACSRGGRTPAQTYAGTWEGRSFRAPGDTGVRWTNVITAGADGKLTGSLTYPGANLPPVAVRVIEVTDSTVVQDLGPYHSVTLNADVITRAEGHIKGDSVWGTFEARPTGGGAPLRGTFAGKRTQRPAT